jgi:hypothetical protein
MHGALEEARAGGLTETSHHVLEEARAGALTLVPSLLRSSKHVLVASLLTGCR